MIFPIAHYHCAMICSSQILRVRVCRKPIDLAFGVEQAVGTRKPAESPGPRKSPVRAII
jgi:hypothetical protein